MSKSKKTNKTNKQPQNNGRNREERRAAVHNPQAKKSSKPLALRIAIIVILVVMVLGFFILPLIR